MISSLNLEPLIAWGKDFWQRNFFGAAASYAASQEEYQLRHKMPQLQRQTTRRELLNSRCMEKSFKNRHRHPALIITTILLFLFTGPTVFAQPSKGNPQQGKVLFEENCMECHGRTGDGTGPVGYFLAAQPADLLSVETRMKSDSELYMIIKDGILFDEMHGWEGLLSNQDIHDVISYIRTLAPPFPQRK